MLKNYFSALLLMLPVFIFSQTSDLFISKYGEGSSNNKFLEIYNGTGATVNLDNYAFPNVSNAPTVIGEYEFWNTFPSGFMLADGDVFVIAHPSADASILAQADMTFSFLSNGDDGFALVANDGIWNDANTNGTVDAGEMTGFTILDWLGDWNGDPGSGWDVAGVVGATQDHTLTRKSSVCSPNNDWAASAGTNATDSEWIVGAIDSGWGTIGSFSGCTSTPSITITSPPDMTELPWGTTSVDVEFTTENAPGGSTVDIIVTKNAGSPVTNSDVGSPFTITPTADGDSFEVTAQLIDGTVLDSQTVNFTIQNTPPTLPIYEAFNYTVAENLGDQSLWTNENSGDDIVIGSGSLSYTGLEASTGNHVSFDGAGVDPFYEFIAATSGEVYSSFIFRVTDQSAMTDLTDGGYFAILGDFDARLWVRPNPDAVGTTFDIGAGSVSSSPPNTSPTTYNIGDDIFVVLSYNIDTNTVNAWINPSGGELSSSTPPAPTLTDADITDVTSINIFRLRQDSSGETPFILFDELRIGTSWDEVTPDVLSIGQEEINAFRIYPNPNTDGILNISSKSEEALDLTIFNVLGQRVLKATVEDSVLNTSELQNGVYLIQITQGQSSVTKRLIINR